MFTHCFLMRSARITRDKKSLFVLRLNGIHSRLISRAGMSVVYPCRAEHITTGCTSYIVSAAAR